MQALSFTVMQLAEKPLCRKIVKMIILFQDVLSVMPEIVIIRRCLFGVMPTIKSKNYYNFFRPEIVLEGLSELKIKLPATRTLAPVSSNFLPVS